jgi:hypothetical protein
MGKALFILLGVTVVFCCGFFAGTRKQPATASFHDMIVNHPRELCQLIDPSDKRVRELAVQLKTPEQAFAFVRDRISNDTTAGAVTAGEALAAGRASCIGKSILLSSLYRAMGAPAENVRVVTGEVDAIGTIIDHAWVEIEHQGACLQQDTSDLLGKFTFAQFPGTAYSKAFIRKEGYTFNDRSFAIVSRLNQVRGGGHPATLN